MGGEQITCTQKKFLYERTLLQIAFEKKRIYVEYGVERNFVHHMFTKNYLEKKSI